MWVRCNPNPKRKHVPDCVIRALAIVLNETWYKIYDDLYIVGREEANVSCADEVWGIYLRMYGFDPFMLPDSCPRCVTIREFTKHFPKGRYVIGTGNHAVAIIDGNYYDSWDSGNEIPSFFWQMNETSKGGLFTWPVSPITTR